MEASNKFEIDRLIETIEALRNQVNQVKQDVSLIKSDFKIQTDFENFKIQTEQKVR